MSPWQGRMREEKEGEKKGKQIELSL